MKAFRLFALPVVLACACGVSVAQDETPGEAEVPEPPKWELSLDFGLSGASGNTDNQDIYAAFTARKETEKAVIDYVATYRKSESDGDDTSNRFFTKGRYTWKFEDSKWGIFVDASLEDDNFQIWDQRVSAHIGPAYRFIDNDKTFLEGRVGFGFVGTYGGSGRDDTTDPEVVIGATLRHKFTEDLSFVANADLLPNLDDTSEYRFLADATLEYSLAESWSLKGGVQEVYDSNPGAGFDESDFYYFVALSAKF
jgi:putative salt-induced outer membrane protein YdiY